MRLGSRGQTTQDFAIGISIFLLTTAFLFAFLPTIFTPFDSDRSASDVAQADRVAATFVENFSVEGNTGQLNASTTEEFFAAGAGGDVLRERYTLPTISRVNVTIRTQNGSVIKDNSGTVLARGDEYDDDVSASSSRIVTFEEDVCDPACRLVVRVW